jgi:hypothetical protein
MVLLIVVGLGLLFRLIHLIPSPKTEMRQGG